MRCRAAVFASVFCLLLLGVASAHPDHLNGLSIEARDAVWDPEAGTVSFTLTIRNDRGAAATLRGLQPSRGEAVEIERGRRFFGRRVWQHLSFVRVEPGEAMTLSPPGYRLTIVGVPADERQQIPMVVVADFGPYGQVAAAMVAAPKKGPAYTTP
ncbi:MAG: hypothetical protein ACWA5T_09385 [Parvularcula sp.]